MDNLGRLFRATYDVLEEGASLASASIEVVDFLKRLNLKWKQFSLDGFVEPQYLISYCKAASEDGVKQPLLLLTRWISDRSSFLDVSGNLSLASTGRGLSSTNLPGFADKIAVAVNEYAVFEREVKFNLRAFLGQPVPLYDIVKKFTSAEDELIPTINCEDLIKEIQTEPWYNGQLLGYVEAGNSARCAELKSFEKLHPAVQMLLETLVGKSNLFLHQTEALDALLEDKNVCVSTSTASGKTLIYILFTCHLLCTEPNAHVLCIYPTKALARNQLLEWRRAFDILANFDSKYKSLGVENIDGDTDSNARDSLLLTNRVILTNFDLIHKGLKYLINGNLIRFLRFCVIDEAHVYKGVFGTHVAYVFRRIICAHRYTAADEWRRSGGELLASHCHVQVLCGTATLGNPLSHSLKLTGLKDYKLISVDGSPTSTRYYNLWSSPLQEAENYDIKTPAIGDAIKLFLFFLRRKVRTFVFCNARSLVELIYEKTTSFLVDEPEIRERVISYRGGYVASYRRELEAIMFSKKILGVVCTNALELGIDIGILDCVITLGFEGSVSSIRQRLGRAGRRGGRPALGFLLSFGNPVESYIIKHMGVKFWTKEPEPVGFCLEDPKIVKQHVLSCLYEIPRPISKSLLVELFGSFVDPILETALENGEVVALPNEFYRFRATNLTLLLGDDAPTKSNPHPAGPKEDVIRLLNATTTKEGISNKNLQKLLAWSDPVLLHGENPDNSATTVTLNDILSSSYRSFNISAPPSVIDIRTSSMPQVQIYLSKNVASRGDSMDTNADNVPENSVLIDEVSLPLSFLFCFPGAVYQYQGRKYISKLFCPKRLLCVLQVPREAITYYTKPGDVAKYSITKTNFTTRVVQNHKEIAQLTVGTIAGTLTVAHYWKKFSTKKSTKVNIDVPKFVWNTYGLRVDLGQRISDLILTEKFENDKLLFRRAYHGLGHIILKLLQSKSWCTESDLIFNCTNFVWDKNVSSYIPMMFIEQSAGLSNGLIDSIFNCKNAGALFYDLLRECRRILDNCECEENAGTGCFACIIYPSCGDRNYLLSRAATRELVDVIMEYSINKA